MQLKAPVRAIHQHEAGVVVQSDAGTFDGSVVIVAIPPTLAGQINYHPSLPEERHQLTQQMLRTATTKCVMVYETPFWRDAGLSGTLYSDEGPLIATSDVTPSDGTIGALVGFMTGDDARNGGSVAKKSFVRWSYSKCPLSLAPRRQNRLNFSLKIGMLNLGHAHTSVPCHPG